VELGVSLGSLDGGRDGAPVGMSVGLDVGAEVVGKAVGETVGGVVDGAADGVLVVYWMYGLSGLSHSSQAAGQPRRTSTCLQNMCLLSSVESMNAQL